MTNVFTRRQSRHAIEPLTKADNRDDAEPLLRVESHGVKKIVTMSKDDRMPELAENYFAIDGDIRKIIRLESDNESDL